MTHYTYCLWPVSDLELTFSVGLQCPWTGQFTEVPLVEGGCNVTVSNEHKVFNNILYIRIYIYIYFTLGIGNSYNININTPYIARFLTGDHI